MKPKKVSRQFRTGLFITFEGGECSGKSTQSLLLYKALQASGIKSILTKEPGGTKAGCHIRNILLDSKFVLTANTQLLLHVASRCEHLSEVILPALNDGAVVICDRFMDSTVAYQSYGYGISADILNALHKTFANNIKPDITFIMDIKFSTFKSRIQSKHKTSDSDRYEALPDAFHKKVLSGFREIAAKYPKRCVLINADASIDQIFDSVKNYTMNSLTIGQS